MRPGASTRGRVIGVAALAALSVAMLGALTTDLGAWYAVLRQPAWKPPDAWFGPIWTTIFALCALAGAKAWQAAATHAQRDAVLVAYALNAFLNLLWSLLFFRLHRPDWSLYEVGFLWASIVVMIVVSARASRAAAALLLPYLAWVAAAAVLNFDVVRLNAPF